MSNNWYSREVHQDSKGFFVFFGGCRFRPCQWLSYTKASLGKWVELNPKPYSQAGTRRQFTLNHIGHILIDGHRETWTIGVKYKIKIPAWYFE